MDLFRSKLWDYNLKKMEFFSHLFKMVVTYWHDPNKKDHIAEEYGTHWNCVNKKLQQLVATLTINTYEGTSKNTWLESRFIQIEFHIYSSLIVDKQSPEKSQAD